MRLLTLVFVFVIALTTTAFAQDRIASPRGEVSTQIGGSYDSGDYTGGKWVVVDYGRPILRGRDNFFGSGDEYGARITGSAPVWRAGANVSTRFMTEADLMIGGKHLNKGEYSLFVELDESGWTLILSNHKAKINPRSDEEGIWGSFGYDQSKDVLRANMELSEAPFSFDQFTISFVNMTQDGGTLAMMWENELATIDFTVMK